MRALAARKPAASAAALDDLRQQLQTDPTTPVFETVTPDGALFFLNREKRRQTRDFVA
ncbi:MAG: hypothetical protein IPM75_13295 [Candidatus Competibacteraceae bacterium]|nr:hypothetical protein [Candidatus Competibacteraceae bacterium]